MRIFRLILFFSIIVNAKLFCMENDKKNESLHNPVKEHQYKEEDLNKIAFALIDYVGIWLRCEIKEMKESKELIKILHDCVKKEVPIENMQKVLELMFNGRYSATHQIIDEKELSKLKQIGLVIEDWYRADLDKEYNLQRTEKLSQLD